MGFDLTGIQPLNPTGEYFRNNVWWWRRLWQFVCLICDEDLTDEQKENGQYNNGYPYPPEIAQLIAEKIETSIQSGFAAQFKDEVNKEREIAKKENKTNKTQKAPFERNYTADYPFTLQNLRNFAKFCKNSNGFKIY